VVAKLPVLYNVIEQRFMAVTILALAVMLAVVIDRCRQLSVGRRPVAWTAALAAAAVALVPIAWVLAPRVPFTARSVDLPRWYAEQAPKLPAGQVLLSYPAPFSGIQSAMAWQAINGMHYAQAGGGGPQGTPERAGAERAGFKVLAALGFGLEVHPPATSAEMAAVRRALRGWGVTMVVIPDQPELPTLLRGRDPGYAAAFMTAALGSRPIFQSGAWVWSSVDLSRPALAVTPAALSACAGHPSRAIPACVAGTVGR
jgi:hypothetical protein